MRTRYGSILLLHFALAVAGCAGSARGGQDAVESAALSRSFLQEAAPAVAANSGEPSHATALPAEPPADCPVTQPTEMPFEPQGASDEAFADRFWHGSEELYLALPRDGTWAQLALGEKVFWWSANYAGEPQPEMTIYAQRLDDPGQAFEQMGATNASHESFPATAMLHGLTVPSHGCWKITGEYKEVGLSFVVWVP